MKVLSVSEFAEFCKKKQPSCYIYATQNQQDSQRNCLRVVLRFQTVIINLKPDRICFLNELDKLSFECVKEVHMFDDRPSIGTIFSIVCTECGDDVEYTFIAD